MTSEQSGGGDFRRSLELLWRGLDEPTRGPKPALTLAQIVRVAIGVADADGLSALSMRRIAAELGVGAMSLYRYVPGKAELIDLMVDEVSGEDLAAADALVGDWRTRLQGFARQLWAFYLRHPWMLQIEQGRPLLGPNATQGTEIALRAVDEVGLTEDEMLATVVLVSSFVAGLARTTIEAMQAADRTGISDTEWWEAQSEYLDPIVGEGKLPMLTKVGEAGAFNSMFDNFEFGLQRVIDGLGVLIAERSERRSAPDAIG